MKATRTLKILPDGMVITLYDDGNTFLKDLGKLEVERASNVKFDAEKQKWFIDLNMPGGKSYRLDNEFESRAGAIEHEKEILNGMLQQEFQAESLFKNAE